MPAGGAGLHLRAELPDHLRGHRDRGGVLLHRHGRVVEPPQHARTSRGRSRCRCGRCRRWWSSAFTGIALATQETQYLLAEVVLIASRSPHGRDPRSGRPRPEAAAAAPDRWREPLKQSRSSIRQRRPAPRVYQHMTWEEIAAAARSRHPDRHPDRRHRAARTSSPGVHGLGAARADHRRSRRVARHDRRARSCPSDTAAGRAAVAASTFPARSRCGRPRS